jgi:hypothetical protein
MGYNGGLVTMVMNLRVPYKGDNSFLPTGSQSASLPWRHAESTDLFLNTVMKHRYVAQFWKSINIFLRVNYTKFTAGSSMNCALLLLPAAVLTSV